MAKFAKQSRADLQTGLAESTSSYCGIARDPGARLLQLLLLLLLPLQAGTQCASRVITSSSSVVSAAAAAVSSAAREKAPITFRDTVLRRTEPAAAAVGSRCPSASITEWHAAVLSKQRYRSVDQYT